MWESKAEAAEESVHAGDLDAYLYDYPRLIHSSSTSGNNAHGLPYLQSQDRLTRKTHDLHATISVGLFSSNQTILVFFPRFFWSSSQALWGFRTFGGGKK